MDKYKKANDMMKHCRTEGRKDNTTNGIQCRAILDSIIVGQ